MPRFIFVKQMLFSFLMAFILFFSEGTIFHCIKIMFPLAFFSQTRVLNNTIITSSLGLLCVINYFIDRILWDNFLIAFILRLQVHAHKRCHELSR